MSRQCRLKVGLNHRREELRTEKLSSTLLQLDVGPISSHLKMIQVMNSGKDAVLVNQVDFVGRKAGRQTSLA